MSDILNELLKAFDAAVVLVIGAAAAYLVAYIRYKQRKLEAEVAVRAAEQIGGSNEEKAALAEKLAPKTTSAMREAAVLTLPKKLCTEDAPNHCRAWWVYEAARLEAIAMRRPIIPELWEVRDEAFRTQFVAVVDRICANPDTTPEAEHDSWVRAYEAMGWRYGPQRDVTAKTHPDMVPFDALDPLEREKDAVFLALCRIAAGQHESPAKKVTLDGPA